jgi:hypothetical protein
MSCAELRILLRAATDVAGMLERMHKRRCQTDGRFEPYSRMLCVRRCRFEMDDATSVTRTARAVITCPDVACAEAEACGERLPWRECLPGLARVPPGPGASASRAWRECLPGLARVPPGPGASASRAALANRSAWGCA